MRQSPAKRASVKLNCFALWYQTSPLLSFYLFSINVERGWLPVRPDSRDHSTSKWRHLVAVDLDRAPAEPPADGYQLTRSRVNRLAETDNERNV